MANYGNAMSTICRSVVIHHLSHKLLQRKSLIGASRKVSPNRPNPILRLMNRPLNQIRTFIVTLSGSVEPQIDLCEPFNYCNDELLIIVSLLIKDCNYHLLILSGKSVVYSCMLCNLCMVLLRMCALVLVSVSDSHVGMTIIDLSESITSEPR